MAGEGAGKQVSCREGLGAENQEAARLSSLPLLTSSCVLDTVGVAKDCGNRPQEKVATESFKLHADCGLGERN